jgi:hypothetical protein
VTNRAGFSDPANVNAALRQESTLNETTDQDKQSRGWFRAVRSDAAMELLGANKNAFLLLYLIAYRAQWKRGFNRFNLEPGQALIGDHETIGLSAREYRTAKSNLQKWQFATFKTTNRGTLATLTSTSIFSILGDAYDKQNDSQATSDRQMTDNQATTTKKVKKEKKAVERPGIPPTLGSSNRPHREMWQLFKDEKSLKERKQTERESLKPDKGIIAALNKELEIVQAEIKAINQSSPSPTDKNERLTP